MTDTHAPTEALIEALLDECPVCWSSAEMGHGKPGKACSRHEPVIAASRQAHKPPFGAGNGHARTTSISPDA